MQDKTPRNENGQRHGHWVMHYSNGNRWWKANFVNDVELGFSEYLYRDDCEIANKEYYAL